MHFSGNWAVWYNLVSRPLQKWSLYSSLPFSKVKLKWLRLWWSLNDRVSILQKGTPDSLFPIFLAMGEVNVCGPNCSLATNLNEGHSRWNVHLFPTKLYIYMKYWIPVGGQAGLQSKPRTARALLHRETLSQNIKTNKQTNKFIPDMRRKKNFPPHKQQTLANFSTAEQSAAKAV